jgi:hypothetical protein
LSNFADDLFAFEDLEGDLEDVFVGDFAAGFAEDLVGDFAAFIDDEDFVGDSAGFWSLSCDFRTEDEPVVETGDSLFPGLFSPLFSVSGSLDADLPVSLVLRDFGREEDLEKSLGRTITLWGLELAGMEEGSGPAECDKFNFPAGSVGRMGRWKRGKAG